MFHVNELGNSLGKDPVVQFSTEEIREKNEWCKRVLLHIRRERERERERMNCNFELRNFCVNLMVTKHSIAKIDGTVCSIRFA